MLIGNTNCWIKSYEITNTNKEFEFSTFPAASYRKKECDHVNNWDLEMSSHIKMFAQNLE